MNSVENLYRFFFSRVWRRGKESDDCSLGIVEIPSPDLDPVHWGPHIHILFVVCVCVCVCVPVSVSVWSLSSEVFGIAKGE